MEGPSKKQVAVLLTGAAAGTANETLESEGALRCEGESVSDELKNPLLTNDEILQCVFEQMDTVEQLNQSRLVCRKWYELSLPSWLKRGPPITIKGNASFRRFIDEFHDVNPRSDHHEAIMGMRQYPKFVFSLSYSRQLFEIFWAQSGARLTHLTLVNVTFSDVVAFRKVMLSNYTPSLKYLDVGVEYVDGPIETDLPTVFGGTTPGGNKNLETLKVEIGNWAFPLDWKLIFDCYPNLKNLAFGLSLSTRNAEILKILQAIVDIRSADNEKLNLTSFTWFFNQNLKKAHFPSRTGPLPISFPGLLRQAQLELESFRFYFGVNESNKLINDVLSLYSTTLKELQLYKPTVLHQSPLFPRMTHLQSLTLSGFPVTTLTFLKELPSLRSLHLWGGKRECGYAQEIISTTAAESQEMKNATFPSLTEFCCNYSVDPVWDRNELNLLAGWLPNLTHLELDLDNTNFAPVCENWPALEHLRLYGSCIGDKGLVGLEWDEEDQLVYKKPNITNLQKLKSFVIEGHLSFREADWDELPTQHSVVFGFLKLPQLARLEIQPKMPSELVEFIRKRIPFAKLSAD